MWGPTPCGLVHFINCCKEKRYNVHRTIPVISNFNCLDAINHCNIVKNVDIATPAS